MTLPNPLTLTRSPPPVIYSVAVSTADIYINRYERNVCLGVPTRGTLESTIQYLTEVRVEDRHHRGNGTPTSLTATYAFGNSTLVSDYAGILLNDAWLDAKMRVGAPTMLELVTHPCP